MATWPGDPIFEPDDMMWSDIRPQAMGFPLSPLVEDAPAPRFQPMERPGGTFLDQLAIAIGRSGAPQPNPRDSRGSRALQALVGGLAHGFSQRRIGDMQERATVEQSLQQRQQERNARAIAENERVRQESSAEAMDIRKRRRDVADALAKERGKFLMEQSAKDRDAASKAAGYLEVSSRLSRAVYGDDRMAGKRVPEEQYRALVSDASAFRPPAGQSGPGNELTWKQITGGNTIRQAMNSDPDVKDFVGRRQGYDQLVAGARQNTAGGDLAVIYGYIRLQDPNAVREGEIRNVEQAQSLLRRFTQLPTKWRNGERLNPAFRDELVRDATALYRSQLPNYERAMDMYKWQEAALGLPAGSFVRDFTSASPESAGSDWFDDNAPGKKK